MPNPHGTPLWYELVTPEPDASARFYGAVLGWTVGPSVMPDNDYRMIEAGDGQVGGVMRLSDEMASGGMRPSWFMYLSVDDVDAAARRIADAGGTVMVEPWTLDGVGRIAFVTDPQGQPFYVMRGAVEDGESTAFSPGRLGRCAWNELVTPDQPGAVAFYGEVFGWRQEGAMPMGDMGEYQFLQADDLPLGAVMRAQGEYQPGWTFTFRVSDAAAAADRIVAAGGTVRHGPVEVPGGDLVVQAGDPLGLTFGVVAKATRGADA